MDHNDDKFEEMKLDNDPSSKTSDHVSYPKINPIEAPVPPPLNKQTSDPSPMGSQSNSDPPKSKSASSTPKSVRWSAELTQEAPAATTMPSESNHYVSAASPTTGESKTSSVKSKVDLAKEVLGRWGKKVGETTKKAEGIAGNVWQHLKTGPSVADAAMGRIAHGTKVLAEGGYVKIFRQTFETVPEEQFQRSYACYLSTSAGPVMGTLYLSTEKLAFCSDNPLSYTVGDKTEWSYYKVVIPLHQLKSVNPSISKVNRAEKYIQVISVDDHEFWFMGFVNYDSAVKYLQESFGISSIQSG